MFGTRALAECVIENPAVPSAVLLRVLLSAEDEQLRRAFRAAPGLPRDVVESGNPHLPPDLVAVLARDEDPYVRDRVSLRPELTEEERAAIDYRVPELTDLDEVAWYPYLSRSQSPVDYARSAHPVRRRQAACAPGLPQDLRDALLGDPDPGVRVLTCRHQPGVPAEDLLRAYREFRGRHRWRLTCRPGFPTRGLARFADDPDPAMRELVVLDPQAPAAVVVGLLADPERCVRTTLAQHPAVPVERLLTMLDDPELAPYAARNPSLPIEAMHRILDATGVPGRG
jgi:hypothetical protein